MGIPLEGSTHIKVERHMLVVKNRSVPELQLEKKGISIAYHHLVAADVGRISCEPMDSNLADMLTKVQSGIKEMN